MDMAMPEDIFSVLGMFYLQHSICHLPETQKDPEAHSISLLLSALGCILQGRYFARETAVVAVTYHRNSCDLGCF